MLNQIVLVGRLTKDVEIKELEGGKKVAYITLAIPKPFKNSEGEYETDFIPVVLYNEVGNTTREYCKKGDIIGVKGRIESEPNRICVIAEKVTFLQTGRGEEK